MKEFACQYFRILFKEKKLPSQKMVTNPFLMDFFPESSFENLQRNQLSTFSSSSFKREIFLTLNNDTPQLRALLDSRRLKGSNESLITWKDTWKTILPNFHFP